MKLHSLLFALVALAAVPRTASAQETAREGAAKVDGTAAAIATPSSEGAAPAVAATPAEPGKGQAAQDATGFVDRDGDGIQDGQEHRFRRQGTARRGKGRGADGGGDGAGLFRRGAPDGAGAGHGAGHGECVGKGNGQ